MVDVFISYKSERRKAAAHLAKILECYGYTVWYDYSLVKGRDFAAQIDAKIREAKAVIVLWCSKSVRSEWVADEAALAAKLDSLVPAKIEDCELRVDFHRKDYIDLTGWGGAPRDHALDVLLAALQQKTGRKPQQNFEAICEYEELWRRFGAPSLKAFALDAPVHAEQESSAGSDPSTLQQPYAPAKRDWEQAKTRHSADTSSLTPRARVQASLDRKRESGQENRLDCLVDRIGLACAIGSRFLAVRTRELSYRHPKEGNLGEGWTSLVTARTRLLAIGKRSLWQFEASPGVWEDCGDDCEKALRRALVTRPDNTSAILQTPLQLQACDGFLFRWRSRRLGFASSLARGKASRIARTARRW